MKHALIIAMLLALGLGSPAAAARTMLTAETVDFYVATGGSDANDCRQLTPCATIQRAVDNIKQNYDTNCLQPWIHIADGTYAGFSDYAPQVGCQPRGGGPLIVAGASLVGTACDRSLVRINGGGVSAVSLDGAATVVILCMTINAPGAAAIYTTNGATAEVGLLNLGPAVNHLLGDGGKIFVSSTLHFKDDALIGLESNKSGSLLSVTPGVSLIFDDGVSFGAWFAFSGSNATLNLPLASLPISGNPSTLSGQRCYASLAGTINTAGRPDLMPGTGTCAQATNSNYGGQVY